MWDYYFWCLDLEFCGFQVQKWPNFSKITNKTNCKVRVLSIKDKLSQNIFNNKDVLIVQQDDQDNFGIYTAGTVQASDGEGGNVKKLALTHKSSNGNISDGKQYAVKFVPGDVDKNYTHNQSSASTTWTINHGLNKFPSVSIKFSSSDSVYTNVGAFAGVTYTDANNLTINLAAAESGYAYLN